MSVVSMWWIGGGVAALVTGTLVWRSLLRSGTIARMFEFGVMSERWLAEERNRKGE